MKILHVVPSYLPAIRYGGPILSVHGLCKGLVRRGHEVHVFTTNVDGPRDSAVPLGVPVDLDGVKVWYFEVDSLRRLFWAPAMKNALRDWLPTFDVLHTHSVFLWPTWAAARAARAHQVPYVLSPRGMLVRELINRKSSVAKNVWLTMVERRNLDGSALVQFTSRREADDARALNLPVHESRIIPNGVELASFDKQGRAAVAVRPNGGRRPFILFIGRINWKKGLDRLIRALASVPGCRLVVAGNDEEHYQPVLQIVAQQAGTADRITFLGSVDGDEKADLLSRALLLVLPSYSENFGNVVLEAMAAGCPVVVTPRVGAADIVRESGGGVVLDGDQECLGAGIRQLISNPSALTQMGVMGREFVRAGYTWDAIANEMDEAYEFVASR